MTPHEVHYRQDADHWGTIFLLSIVAVVLIGLLVLTNGI